MAKLCPRGKAAAKRKFKVYPSAYANMYASAVCSGKVTPGGKKNRKKESRWWNYRHDKNAIRKRRYGIMAGQSREAQNLKMKQQARRKTKKNIEDVVGDTATDNIFSKFKTQLAKAEKQYKDIPSGMKKDPKTKKEIQTKININSPKGGGDEFKDTEEKFLELKDMVKVEKLRVVS